MLCLMMLLAIVQQTQADVYVQVKDNLGWGSWYVYLYSSSYWDNNNGSGANNIKWCNNSESMKKFDGGSEIGTIYYKIISGQSRNSNFISFTKDAQCGYGNFYQTKAIYRGDFSADNKLYTPNTTSNETKNQTTYYNSDGSWGDPVYAIKHNWNEEGWTWKKLTKKSDGVYTVTAKYGGGGCDYFNYKEGYVGSPTLIGNPQKGDECTFTLTLSNNSITIEKPCSTPSISTHPSTAAQSYCQGATATALSVTASGTTPLSYQWQKSSTQSGSYSDISGATSSSYTPSTTTTGTTFYKCKVTNSCGSATSDASGAITVTTPTNYYLGGFLNLKNVTTHTDAWELTEFTPDNDAEFAYRGVFYFTSTSGDKNSEFPIILSDCDKVYNPSSNNTQLETGTGGVTLTLEDDFSKKCEIRYVTPEDLNTFVFTKSSSGTHKITFNYPYIAGTFNEDWSPSRTMMISDENHLSSDKKYRLRYHPIEINDDSSISFKITNGGWKSDFGGSDWGYSDGYDATQSTLSPNITVRTDDKNNIVLTNNSGQKVSATIYFDKDQKIFVDARIPCTPPTKYDVSGPSSVCAGSNAEITLSSSQTGYTYELYKDGVATSTTQAGTGSSLTFSAKVSGSSAVAFTIKGYVTGTPTCNADMNGTVTVTPTALPSAPSGSNINVCSGSDAVFSASQTNNRCIDWYTASTGGTQLATCQTSYTKTNLTSNYTVYVEARNADNGCVSQSRTEITATVNALPTASISGNETVCQNGSLTLTGSGGTQYSWNDGTYSATNTFNVTTSSDGQQTIKLKVKDANNCVSTETSKGVTVNAIPSITSIAAGTGNNECGTGNVTFNSTGATSGATIQWYENSIILSEGTATSYTLEITGGSSKTLKAKAVKDGCESGFTEEATGSRKANPVVSKDLASPTAYEVITLSTNLGTEVTWSKTDANAYFVKDQQAVGGNEVTAETIVLKAPAGSYSITTKKSGECDGNIDITVGTATEVCN